MRTIIAVLLLISTLLSHSAFAVCGNSWFNSNRYLSDYMKQVLVNAWAIPVYSQTLGSSASFNNLIIEYETNESRAVETGEGESFATLNGAKGFARITFLLERKFIDIPDVSYDLNTHYPRFKKGLEIKKVKVKVSAVGSYGNIVAQKIFELELGRNSMNFCAFNSIKENIKRINVELESYSFEYLYSTTRNWD